jgi:glycine cleavage system transcriptional repressor
MLLFTGQKQGLPEQVTKECRRLEKEKNISAFVRELEGEITKPIKNFTTHSLYVEGVDQAGMVYKISEFLYKNSINISKLLSRQTMSPQSGTTIYTIEIEIQVPKEKSPDELEHDFTELGNQLQIDFHIDRT